MPKTPANLIAKLNAEAKRVETAMAKTAERARLRALKEAQTLARREAKVQKAREKIGTVIRKTYAQNNTVTKLVAKHGGLTPKNLLSAATAFGSPAFSRAAKNEHDRLKKKIGEYKTLWGAWYRTLPSNQRVKLSRELATFLHGATYNNNGRLTYGHLSKSSLNPLLYVTRALNTARPPRPTVSYIRNNQRGRADALRWDRRWQGTNQSFYYLSEPEANDILHRYGLPFSMVNARRNLLALKRNTEMSLRRRAERNNPRNNVPWRVSLRYAVKQVGDPLSPPKGQLGYAGGRARRVYRRRTERGYYTV
jgi:hypothetical protein